MPTNATVDVYVEKVTDSFGYFSTSAHDFRFAEATSTTDENALVISNSYDNFGRLKDASVSPQAGTAPTHVMTVSGRVIFDAFGRTIQQYYPITEPTGQQGVFNAVFDASTPLPTATTYDILDRVTKVTVRRSSR